MRKLAIATLLCVAAFCFAQEKKAVTKEAVQSTKLHGYVVDHMCAKGMVKKTNPMERAAKHNKECALEEACAASGFGLVYDNGKWIKFDENGDKLAKEMFESSKKDNDFMADAVGVVKGDKFVVASLTESKMSDGEMKKPAKKEDAHEGHEYK